MLISSILQYVRERTGETDDSTLLESLNNTWKMLWTQVDIENTLFEIDVQIDPTSHVVTAPWYCYQIKGVKRCSGVPQRLYSPRPYYHDYTFRQGMIEFRMLHKRPLFKHLTGGLQLTFRLKRPNSTMFTLTVKGNGEFGVTEWEDHVFNPGDTEWTTTAVYYDLSALSKSAITETDIEVVIDDVVYGILPADQTEAWCQVIRVVDANLSAANTGADSYFTVLYKAYPPVFTRVTDVIPDDWGLVLQQALTAERLETKKDKDDQERADKFGRKAYAIAGEVVRKTNEGRDNPVHLSANPFIPTHWGHL